MTVMEQPGCVCYEFLSFSLYQFLIYSKCMDYFDTGEALYIYIHIFICHTISTVAMGYIYFLCEPTIPCIQ